MTLPTTIRFSFIQIQAFTLVELMIVLAIIAIISAVAVPYSANSYESILIERDITAVKHYLNFCIQKSESQCRRYRFVIDVKAKTYWLEFFRIDSFVPIPGPFGRARNFSSYVVGVAVSGFASDDQRVFSLFYSPDKRWPKAHLEIFTESDIYRISIDSRKVDVERSISEGIFDKK